ncbi:MAG: hypothetical protein M3273_00335, partial [Actinomycetota bacterium]|nr:hypothetical protein [Actinomycetota bacterium]
AEAVKALDAIGSPEARAALEAYVAASPDLLPHRSSKVVQSVFERLRGAERKDHRPRGHSET